VLSLPFDLENKKEIETAFAPKAKRICHQLQINFNCKNKSVDKDKEKQFKHTHVSAHG